MAIDLANPAIAMQEQTVRALASNLVQFPGKAIVAQTAFSPRVGRSVKKHTIAVSSMAVVCY
jgi:hypothetical protein